MRRYSLPLVLTIGAAALAYARGPLDMTWNITPLAVGVVALLAAATLPNPRPWTVGIVLVVWGAAVLLVREGPLPGREAPVYMVALGIALLVAQVVADGRGEFLCFCECITSRAAPCVRGAAIFSPAVAARLANDLSRL